jgi:hypothetical protein
MTVEVTELVLAEPDHFPVGAGPGDQPLSLALAALTGLEEGEEAVIQILARPVPSSKRRKLLKAARSVKLGLHPGRFNWRSGPTTASGHTRPSSDPWVEADVRAILSKAATPLFECVIRLAVTSNMPELAIGRIHSLAGAFAVFEGRNGFRRRRVRRGESLVKNRRFGKSYLLSAPELAQIASLPAAGSVPGLERAGARAVRPVKAVASSGKILGVTDN